MQIITKRIRLSLIILCISCSMTYSLNAQTPADDPGIGGPGVGAAPAGDGSPIVPFDSNMNWVFLGSSILLLAKFSKEKWILALLN